MTVSLHLPDRLIIVHTEPDRNCRLLIDDAEKALEALDLARDVLVEHIAKLGGDITPSTRNGGTRWEIAADSGLDA